MKNVKQVIDHLLMLLLPVLMAELLTGQELHEWLGILMGALFIAHHLLNLGWYRALPKGKYTPYRALLTGVDVLLFAVMFALVGSGIVMSGYVLPGVFRGGRMTARRLHLFASHWGLVLMSVHLGLHWQPALDALHLDKKAPAWTAALRVLAAAWAAFGLYAFIAQHVPDYLLDRAAFLQMDEGQTGLSLSLGYLGMIGLFTAAGHCLAKLAKRSKAVCPKPLVFLLPVALCVLAAVFCFVSWTGGGQPSGNGNSWGGQNGGHHTPHQRLKNRTGHAMLGVRVPRSSDGRARHGKAE